MELTLQCVWSGETENTTDYSDFQIVIGSTKKKIYVQGSDEGLI